MPEEAVQESVESTPEETKPDWDKSRQQIDQLSASLRKASDENAALRSRVDETHAKLAELEKGMKVNQTARVEIEELDPLRADVPDVVNQNRKLIEQLRTYGERVKVLESLASEFKETERKRSEEKQRQEMIENILKPLDERFGAKFRTEAKKLADQRVDNGEVPRPKTELQAFLLLEKCYKEVREKAEQKAVTPKIPADNGFGGVPFNESETKEGSLQEVLSDMKKRKR